jgi:hypothetical protein
VFVRAAGQPYGAAIDAGLPAAGSGGALAYDVGNLADGVTYYFSVKGRTVDGTRQRLRRGARAGHDRRCLTDRCCPRRVVRVRAPRSTARRATTATRAGSVRSGACATPTESALDTVRLKVTSRSAAPRVTATGSFAAVALRRPPPPAG